MGKESLNIFENILVEVLEEILNPDTPFNQTEELEYCAYCPFRAICSR
jgi:CRISPR/Cas system-associated exonuclease Cas4 (RecB family)